MNTMFCTDEITNTVPAEKVLLAVSFGTSFNENRDLTIGAIETELKNAYPDYQVRRAFTSQMIMAKLAKRDGLHIDNVEQAMKNLIRDGVKEVVIQPTHVMPGYEYDGAIAEAMMYKDQFKTFRIGRPLLSDDRDFEEVADIVVKQNLAFRDGHTAIVLVGHGSEHEANSVYTKFQEVLDAKGCHDFVIGTVEASPTLEDVYERVKKMDVQNVILRPFMVVAGDHATNDIAGDEDDSWNTFFTKHAYQVKAFVEGLGQIEDIRKLYVRHAQDAMIKTQSL